MRAGACVHDKTEWRAAAAPQTCTYKLNLAIERVNEYIYSRFNNIKRTTTTAVLKTKRNIKLEGAPLCTYAHGREPHVPITKHTVYKN